MKDSKQSRRRTALVGVRRSWSALWLVGCVLALSSAGVGAAAPEPARAIVGNWLTEPGDGIIEISVAGDGSFQGRIIGGNAPGRLDEKNPDPAKRHNKVRGTLIMRGLHFDDGVWTGGNIYDPNTGNDYKCKLELQDGEHLKVRGYIGFSLLGRSQVWTRYHGTSLDLPPAKP